MTEIYQFKITLAHSKPSIWRRVLVPSSFSLRKFHDVIQTCFNWDGSHLYLFDIYKEILDDEQPRSLSQKLSKLGLNLKKKFRYIYDFGDDWEHDIVLEKIILDKANIYPFCVAGERAAPPEDCGGVCAYEEKLEILADKNHPDYEEVLEWMGEDFIPELFNIAQINKQLNRMIKKSVSA